MSSGAPLDFSANLLDGMSEPLTAIADALNRIASVMADVSETMSEGFSQATAASEELSASIDRLTGATDQLDGSISALDGNLQANTAALEENTAALDTESASADGASGALDTLATSAKAILMPLGIATAAVVGLGAVAVHMAGDFQEGLTSLVTGAGEAQSNLQLVSDGIMSLSETTGESTSQLIAGMYMIESAGYHGKAGLDVLTAAAEGAKVGSADLGTVADATTTILNDFGNTGVTAAQAVNELTATVAEGKTHLQDLSGALAQVLPTASAAKVGLNDVMGAMATMTSEGVPAANAATYLRQLLIALDAPSAGAAKALKSVGLTTTEVADEMQKSLPDTLKMITDAVGKKFPVGSAEYVAALKAIAGGSKQMQGILDLTGQHLGTFDGDVKSITESVKNGGNAVNGWALVQEDFNTKMAQAGATVQVAMIKIGQALLPVATVIVAHIQPAVERFSQWAETHGPQIQQIVLIVAGALGGALAGAIAIVTVNFLIMNAATIGITAAIALVAAGAIFLAEHWKQVQGAFSAFKPVGDAVHRALQGIGDVVHSVIDVFQRLFSGVEPVTHTFDRLQTTTEKVGGHFVKLHEWVSGTETVFTKLTGPLATIRNILTAVGDAVGPLVSDLGAQLRPILNQLGLVLKENLIPAWHGIQEAFETIKPYLIFTAALIGGVVVTAVGLLVGVLHGLIQGLSQVLQGAIRFASGFIQAVSGAFQIVASIIGGVFNIIKDIFTGNWSAIGKDTMNALHGLWNGIQNLFGGLWHMIQGVFQAGINGVLSFIGGFVGGVIHFFQHLFDKLVGHSIVTDGMKLIGSVIANGLQAVLGNIGGFITSALGHFNDLLKSIPIVGGMVSGVEKGFSTMAHVAGNILGGLVNDTADKTAIMRDKAAIHTEEMKAQVDAKAEAMHLAAAKSAENMKAKILAAIMTTKDPAKRHALEMQLAVVEQNEKMHVAAAAHARQMKEESLAHMAKLEADAKAHAAHMKEGVLGHIGDMKDQALSTIGTFAGNAVSNMKTLATNLLGALANLPGQMAGLAGNIMGGLANGLKNAAGGAINAMKNVGGQILGGIGNLFGIHSPSTVMREIGGYLMDGLVNGVTAHSAPQTIQRHFATMLDATRKQLNTHSLSGAGAALATGAATGMLASAVRAGGNAPTHQTISLNITGGLGAGLKMMNARDRQQFAEQIAAEMQNVGALQGKQQYGYTGF